MPGATVLKKDRMAGKVKASRSELLSKYAFTAMTDTALGLGQRSFFLQWQWLKQGLKVLRNDC